ncbi:PREDICTED: TMV resistance protein N-like [Fragaria vesca subsp. vesca]|uniref:TMV resistance protein N-like n=1 Tax=Fragaria vesca subsp. vesca TaxID=101020 RepID=UPI0002C2F968|nr:PREDICTED: TMV resistance protein N-like [Fragaria vesca subsp. vesca]
MASYTTIHASSFSFFSSATRRRHDVFLSFRGEDTRHNITKGLHSALVDAGVPTFKDDVNLQKGCEIMSDLLKAIQMSRIAIIVFSKNYASSGWCLDELVKIVECNKDAGQLIMPIFCDVDPCDVQQQTGTFSAALDQHERTGRTEDKLEAWRTSLTEAASQPYGFDMQDAAAWLQSKFIKEIVKHVLSRYQDAHLSVSIFPPRLDAGKEYMNSLLGVISDDILIIGICGIDKTDLAQEAYDQNFHRFESSSFIKDVNKMAEQPNGLVALQKRFLSDMLEVDNVDINDVKEGTELIKYEARRKRVLFILDNLNKLDQLNALARSRDWFGSGSRIVITTRDPQLLSVLEVDNVYGEQGIEVLETQFQQNLQMIKDMEETIRGPSFQAHDLERSLIAKIEAERRKNNAQAQIIAELQKNSKSSFPLYALDSTTDVLLDGKGPETFEGYDDHEALLSIFAENEMIIGDANVNDQLKAKMQFLNVGAKDFNKAVSSGSSSKGINSGREAGTFVI